VRMPVIVLAACPSNPAISPTIVSPGGVVTGPSTKEQRNFIVFNRPVPSGGEATQSKPFQQVTVRKPARKERRRAGLLGCVGSW
jgi:hypothetical protein